MWDNSASESLQVEDERQETDHQYNMVTTADFFVSVLFLIPTTVEPLYNEFLSKTNDFLYPSNGKIKLYEQKRT